MTPKAVVYARVSSDDRGKDGRNLQGQLEMGREYAEEHGYTVVAELPEDDRGASGAEIDLPELTKVRDMARAGEFDVLVVRELDRLSRNLAKQLIVEQELQRAGVRIEYVLGEYADTPEGRLNKHIKATIAEFEREKIAERMTRGRRNTVKAGNVLVHGRPPYGYRVSEDGKTLVIHEPEARVVRLIFTWYAEGDETGKKLGARAIARELSALSVPTWKDLHGKYKKQGYGQWSSGTISTILKNETYCGTWSYGKRSSKGRNPREQWLSLPVPAIISRELWNRAQRQRNHNREMAKRNEKHDYLLGRRVTCGRCGSKAHGFSSSYISSRGERVVRYLYYRCSTTTTQGIVGKECSMPGFRVDHVDATVWAWIRSRIENPDLLAQDIRAQQAEREEVNKPLRGRLEVVGDLLADYRRQMERLLDLYLTDGLDRDMLVDREARLQDTITALEQERADIAAQLEAATLTDGQIETIEEYAARIGRALDIADTSFEARRHLIELLDMRAVMRMEDGAKVLDTRCVMGNQVLRVENGNINSYVHNGRTCV
jgi:site-specific DNA recombinase